MKTKKSGPTFKADPKAGTVRFELPVGKDGVEPLLGAAYLLTDRAYVALDGDRKKKLSVTLTSKTPASRSVVDALAKTFIVELETQRVRWAISKNNLPVREYIAEQAILMANGRLPAEASPSADPGPSDELTDEQRKEIENLISEVEGEIRDLNDKKNDTDPKKVSASWEEKQQSKQAAS